MGTELVFEAMRKAGYEPSSVAVAGGATRSPLWLQVCVCVSSIDEGDRIVDRIRCLFVQRLMPVCAADVRSQLIVLHRRAAMASTTSPSFF